MLKIKYYKNFKGEENFLLIAGSADAYKNAISSIKKLDGCLLSSFDFITIEDSGSIDPGTLFLTKEECALFVNVCERLVNNKKAAHDYLSIQSLPEADLLISCGEYKTLP